MLNKEHKDVSRRRSRLLVFIFCGLLIWSGCDKQTSEPTTNDGPAMSELIVQEEFDFSTTRDVQLDILVTDNRNEQLENVRLEIYTADPDSADGKLLTTGATNSSGRFTATLGVAAELSKVWVRSVHVGVMPGGYVAIDNGIVRATFGYDNIGFLEDEEKYSFGEANTKTNFVHRYLGSWNSQGRPLYRESEGDVIDSELLDRVNASLPERRPVPQYHPDYLVTGSETNLELTADGNVWISFLHEGAGWKNVLAFYTYDVNNPPASRSEIDSVTIVFPNVSAKGSGGALRNGDKVHLGEFPAGTGIGWLLFGNGWNGQITEGVHTLFSHQDLNPESDPALRQHNVLLRDDAGERLILGFEDLNREWSSCDNDFNDAIFLVTCDQYSSINTEDMRPLDITLDTDGDGISDYYDDYPNDPTRSFNNHLPAENLYGTLAFEDQWPNLGDYDFNDVVVDYNYNLVTNVQNQVVELKATFVLKAVGAAFENGFGFQLENIASSDVASVIGYEVIPEYINLNANGTEAGQTRAVIIAFDNSNHRMSRPNGFFVNTQPEAPYVTPDTIDIAIVFNSPVDASLLGEAPFNPFIIVNKDRGREVHLPNNHPTDLADQSFFGTGEDRSRPSAGIYYRDINKLTWGIHLPEEFAYPKEFEELIKGYNHFKKWAESSGGLYPDWYTGKSGYRNNPFIYQKP